MRNIRIKIEIDDRKNNIKMESETTLQAYRDIKFHDVDPIEEIVDTMNREMDYRLKNDKDRAHINLGEIYHLDLGGSHPIEVRPTEFTLDGKVKCDYLGSYPNRTEILDANMF